MLISCDVVNMPYSCFYEREETKRCRWELDSYYVHTVFRYAFSFPRRFFFLRTYRIYHKGYSDEGQRSRYTRKMAEGHSAILGKIHEPSLSCVLYYGRIATDCSSVRCRKSQMDKPKKRVTMPRYNGVTNKAIICSLPPLLPLPSTPTVHRYRIWKTIKLSSAFTLNYEFTFHFISTSKYRYFFGAIPDLSSNRNTKYRNEAHARVACLESA